MLTLSKFSMALACAAFAGFAAVPAAAAMRIVDGQAYWSGDPGPVDPGAYWTAGQRYADPHHYMSWYGKDPQDYTMIVYARHAGASRCVWRARVVNTYWEFAHPYLRVCR
jgi:hypothetical protein